MKYYIPRNDEDYRDRVQGVTKWYRQWIFAICLWFKNMISYDFHHTHKYIIFRFVECNRSLAIINNCLRSHTEGICRRHLKYATVFSSIMYLENNSCTWLLMDAHRFRNEWGKGIFMRNYFHYNSPLLEKVLLNKHLITNFLMPSIHLACD